MTQPSRILIVEDNDRNRKLFRLLVSNMGYECLVAEDGVEGVRIARTEQPDLVLMDIQMAHLDGISAMTQLHADPLTGHIPVIAVTSYAMPGDRERLLAAGFTDYLAKPIDTDEFRQVIGKVLAKRHGDS